MARQLKLSWARFVLCILLMSAFPAILFFAIASDGDSWLPIAAMLPFLISLFVFFGFGWARLRRANLASPIPATDIGQVFLSFFGPALPAAIWLGLTLFWPVAVMLVWALWQVA